MTTFESILLLAVTACVIIIAFGVIVIKKMFQEIIDKKDTNCETLSGIHEVTVDIFQKLDDVEDNILDVCDQQQSAWACDMTTIIKGINELNDVVDKMHRNLCVEIADKMVDRAYPPTYVTPCYAPNGICTNPQMDCINCPKRGTTGGTWSTSTNLDKND